ncbi:hypothetical protein BsWGS_27080 [Bradybaena similaris]
MPLPAIKTLKPTITHSQHKQRRVRRIVALDSGKPKNMGDKLLHRKSVDVINNLPALRKLDIDKFRNSYRHNLCLDMLTTGYHSSFCELVTLIRQQVDRREAAGPESFLWNKPLLENQTVKLDFLKRHMTKAEAANRNDHYREAAKNFESYHKLALARQNEWFMRNGVSFYIDSCVKLFGIYTIIGLELGRSGDREDNETSLNMLVQALDMAVKSKNKKLAGEASYNLGLAYQKNNQLDNALTHLFTFYDTCQGDSNSEGTGQACDAIAKIYARQGNKEKSVEFLKRFVELTEKTGLEREYSMACYNLGNVCNSVGNYDEATEYFSKAYNISRVLQDPFYTNINRVQYGIAVAHRMMGHFVNHVLISDRLCLDRLVAWKSVKRDEFHLLIPDTDPGAAVNVLLPPPLSEAGKDVDDSKDEGAEGDENYLEEDQHAKAAVSH